MNTQSKNPFPIASGSSVEIMVSGRALYDDMMAHRITT